jgi:hypothetical protein
MTSLSSEVAGSASYMLIPQELPTSQLLRQKEARQIPETIITGTNCYRNRTITRLLYENYPQLVA